MIDNLKKWLADKFDTTELIIEAYFNDKNVTGFLIIWTIFELTMFDGFLRYSDIKRSMNMYSDLWNDELQSQFEYFHERYHDKEKYRKLISLDTEKAEMSNIFKNGLDRSIN